MRNITFLLLFIICSCGPATTDQSETNVPENEPEELIIPTGNYDFPFEFDYLSHISDELKEGVREGEYMEYYIIGWSADGKMAYAWFDDVAIAIMSVFVQDIYTNEDVWEGSFEIMEEDDSPLITAALIWEAEQPTISEKLRSFGISPLTSKIETQKFPVAATLSDESTHNFAADLRTESGEEGSIVSETIFLRREDGVKKEVFSEQHDEFELIERIELAGGIETMDLNQMVISKVHKGLGFEGMALYLNFIGVDLASF